MFLVKRHAPTPTQTKTNGIRKRKRKTQQNAYIVCRCCRFARLIKRHVLRRVLRVSTHKARAEGTTCPHIACSRIKMQALFKQKRSCRRVECSLLTSAFHVYAKYGFTFISILQLMHCICLLICAMEKKNKVYLFPKISWIYIDNYCFYFLFHMWPNRQRRTDIDRCLFNFHGFMSCGLQRVSDPS